jgi:hypothetical protein
MKGAAPICPLPVADQPLNITPDAAELKLDPTTTSHVPPDPIAA